MSLDFREKRRLQKVVAEKQAALRGGDLGFKAKREAQKAMRDALTKLGAGGKAPAPAGPSPIDPAKLSPGDPVEWRNEMGTIRGNYRGVTDDGRHAVIVHDGGKQTSAPVGEVFPVEERAPEIPPRARKAFDRLVLPLTGVAEGLESARATDRKFNGDGRYAGEFMAKEETRGRLADAEKAISERLGRIEDQSMLEAARAYIDAQRPDLTLTQAEQEWRDSIANDEPVAGNVTLTAQAVRGDFNDLALPEFINKLKEAYGADEDLDGAKNAAVGYLEANRDELEAA